ncbi:MAG: extensin family protein [Pseudomonadota bacterium]
MRRQVWAFALAISAVALTGCGGRGAERSGAETGGLGTVCGDPRLVGARIGAIDRDAPIAGCGAPEGVRLTSVAGVRIEPAAITTCPVARSLAGWVENSVQPASRQAFGRPVTSLRNAASYACRSRNNQPGAPLSEHGRAAAIDISSFRLSGQGFVPVLGGWDDPRSAGFLRSVWRGACGPFTTVLGPEADRFHQDHFHLDVAPRRSAYCR